MKPGFVHKNIQHNWLDAAEDGESVNFQRCMICFYRETGTKMQPTVSSRSGSVRIQLLPADDGGRFLWEIWFKMQVLLNAFRLSLILLTCQVYNTIFFSWNKKFEGKRSKISLAQKSKKSGFPMHHNDLYSEIKM